MTTGTWVLIGVAFLVAWALTAKHKRSVGGILTRDRKGALTLRLTPHKRRKRR